MIALQFHLSLLQMLYLDMLLMQRAYLTHWVPITYQVPLRMQLLLRILIFTDIQPLQVMLLSQLFKKARIARQRLILKLIGPQQQVWPGLHQSSLVSH